MLTLIYEDRYLVDDFHAPDRSTTERWQASTEHPITEQLKRLLAVPETCIVFKTSLSKLRLAVPFGATVEASGFAYLSLTLTHVEELAAAPSRPVRPELVAQARVEKLTLISGKPKLAAHDVRRFWG